jgi:hypothetical protein
MKNKQNNQNNSFPKERSSSKEREKQNQREACASLNALRKGLLTDIKTE